MEIKERYLNIKRRLFDKVYSSLNAPQRESVFTTRGPLLILAGAGSGKTTVLVKRIAFIIKYGNAYYSDFVPEGISERDVAKLESALDLTPAEIEPYLSQFAENPCPPYAVLAITFTNKAANEIKHRLAAAFDNEEVANDIWAGTFHSICVRMLRVHAEKVGYGPNFNIYDADDSKRAMLAAMKNLGIDDKTLPIKSVMNTISRAKDALMTPSDFLDEAGREFRLKKIGEVYEEYQKNLRISNALDFDDIIMQTVKLLREHEEVRRYYQNKFKYVCVDEFQDTNVAQFELTNLLIGHYRNLMVVGDDDQSIYKFRGATIENILSFDKTYPDAKVVKLEQNYRSTQNILDAANAVIGVNTNRKGKNLWTSQGEGDKIVLRLSEDQNSEAMYIVDKINEAVAKGEASYRDFAILYRTNAQSNSIERTFAKSGVPYRMLGGIRFNDRKEIRDVVAYLQLINNHSDAERLLRIINEPKRKIGDKTIDAIRAIASEQEISLFEVIKNADKYAALGRSANILLGFAALIEKLTKILEDGCPLDAFVNQVLDMSGYRQMLVSAGEEERDRLENLEEFISGVIEYMKNTEEPTLGGFLEETMLVSDVDKYDESADACVMMTIHSAKGLEFPIVFLPGMEDGLFPGSQTVMSASAEDMEEERRLAYVAITRAKRKLYIIHTRNRMIYGRTSFNPVSRFVSEIPTSLIYKDAPPKRSNSYSSFGTGGFGGYGGSAATSRGSFVSVGTAKTSSSGFGGVGDKVTIGKTFTSPVKQGAGERFSEGDRVSHMTFGEGEILSVKPMGADVLYEIAFEKVGTKKLMATYAKLKKIN